MKILSTCHVLGEDFHSNLRNTSAVRILSRGYRDKTRASSTGWVGRSPLHIIRNPPAGWGGILPRKCDLAQSDDLRTGVERTRARGLRTLWAASAAQGQQEAGELRELHGEISRRIKVWGRLSPWWSHRAASVAGRENALRAPRSLPTRRTAPRRDASGLGTHRGSRNPSRAVFADRGTDTRTGTTGEGCRRDETGETNSIFVERRSPRRATERRGDEGQPGERRFKVIDRAARSDESQGWDAVFPLKLRRRVWLVVLLSI